MAVSNLTIPLCWMTMQIYFCFKGNYDQYVKTREELEENQMKRFNWEQDQIAHMKVREMPMEFSLQMILNRYHNNSAQFSTSF